MIDALHCKFHQHVAAARGRNQDMGRTKKDKIASGRGCARYADQGYYKEATTADCNKTFGLVLIEAMIVML